MPQNIGIKKGGRVHTCKTEMNQIQEIKIFPA